MSHCRVYPRKLNSSLQCLLHQGQKSTRHDPTVHSQWDDHCGRTLPIPLSYSSKFNNFYKSKSNHCMVCGGIWSQSKIHASRHNLNSSKFRAPRCLTPSYTILYHHASYHLKVGWRRWNGSVLQVCRAWT